MIEKYFHWSELENLINRSLTIINKNWFMIKLNPKIINKKYIEEGQIDYICYYRNCLIGIEAKKTINDKYFYLSKITYNQKKWLCKFEKLGLGLVFFYFEYYKKYILIKYSDLKNISNKNSCKINNIIKFGVEVKIYKNPKEEKILLIKNAISKVINLN